jgi:hypothetical protein
MNLNATKLKLRFITIAVNEEFFTVVRKGMNDAAAAMQLEAELVGTPDVSARELIKLTRQAIADRVDGVALNVFEPNTFVDVIAEAKSAGIPVIAFNIDAAKGASGNLSYIMQDFHAAGKALGLRAAASIDQGAAAIVTVHDDGVGALEERLAGIQAGLSEHGIRWRRLCTGQNTAKGAKLAAARPFRRFWARAKPTPRPPGERRSFWRPRNPMLRASTFLRASSISWPRALSTAPSINSHTRRASTLSCNWLSICATGCIPLRWMPAPLSSIAPISKPSDDLATSRFAELTLRQATFGRQQ